MPPIPKDPKDEEFEQRKRDEATKFYDGWIRQLDDGTEEGSITPSVGGPRITKYKGEFYVDPQGRPWDDGTPPADLQPMTREDAVAAAVEADLAAHADEGPSVEDVQGALNFRSLDFYELIEVGWYQQVGIELRVGKDFSDDADLDLRRFISTLADRAREKYLAVYTEGGQRDGFGNEIPEGKITLDEYARRVTAALRVLFYGGE